MLLHLRHLLCYKVEMKILGEVILHASYTELSQEREMILIHLNGLILLKTRAVTQFIGSSSAKIIWCSVAKCAVVIWP